MLAHIVLKQLKVLNNIVSYDFIEFTDLLYNCMIQKVTIGRVSLIRTINNYVEQDYDKYILINNINKARSLNRGLRNAKAIVIEIKAKDYYNEGDYGTIETVIINYVNDDENYKSDDIYITNVGFLHDLKYI